MHFVMIHKLWLYQVCCTHFLLGRDAKGDNCLLLLFQKKKCDVVVCFLFSFLQLLRETTSIPTFVDAVLYKYNVVLYKYGISTE